MQIFATAPLELWTPAENDWYVIIQAKSYGSRPRRKKKKLVFLQSLCSTNMMARRGKFVQRASLLHPVAETIYLLSTPVLRAVTSPNQIAVRLLCQRRLNARADDIAVESGGQLLRLVSQGGERALWQRYRGDDDNGSVLFLRPATDDASVPPRGRLAVASAVVDGSGGLLIDVEAAPMPPRGRRVECWQQCRPRRNNGNLI